MLLNFLRIVVSLESTNCEKRVTKPLYRLAKVLLAKLRNSKISICSQKLVDSMKIQPDDLKLFGYVTSLC